MFTRLRSSKPPPPVAYIKKSVNYSGLYHADIVWLCAAPRTKWNAESRFVV